MSFFQKLCRATFPPVSEASSYLPAEKENVGLLKYGQCMHGRPAEEGWDRSGAKVAEKRWECSGLG